MWLKELPQRRGDGEVRRGILPVSLCLPASAVKNILNFEDKKMQEINPLH